MDATSWSPILPNNKQTGRRFDASREKIGRKRWISASRVSKPFSQRPRDKAKAKVEAAVRIVERWLLRRLRNRRIYSLADVNAAIAELLIRLNDQRVLRYVGRTRRRLFEEIDVPLLRPLPNEPYVLAEWRMRKVGLDYHVDVEGHFYSVPYRHARASVERHLRRRHTRQARPQRSSPGAFRRVHAPLRPPNPGLTNTPLSAPIKHTDEDPSDGPHHLGMGGLHRRNPHAAYRSCPRLRDFPDRRLASFEPAFRYETLKPVMCTHQDRRYPRTLG
jgi:hypothetical protein